MSDSSVRLHSLAAGALALGLAGGLAAAPAYAGPSPLTGQLCGDDTVACSIRVTGVVREGVHVSVAVTGRPRTRVPVQLYRVEPAADRIARPTPVGPPVAVETNDFGTAWASLPVPQTDATAGWALVSVGDVTTGDPAELVGTIEPLGARRPTLLGDGYADQKPVGRDLELHLHGAVTGHRFAVEYRDEGGVWRDATRPSAVPRDPQSGVSQVTYQVPRGLRAQAYPFRLRNLTDPAEPVQWQVIPSTNGAPAPRQAPWRPPTLGQRVAGAQPVVRHDAALVRMLAGGLAIAAVGSVAFGALRAARRLPARAMGGTP